MPEVFIPSNTTKNKKLILGPLDRLNATDLTPDANDDIEEVVIREENVLY